MVKMHASMSRLETIECLAENIEYYNSLQLWNAERRLFSSHSDYSEFEDQIKENPELKNPYRLEVK